MLADIPGHYIWTDCFTFSIDVQYLISTSLMYTCISPSNISFFKVSLLDHLQREPKCCFGVGDVKWSRVESLALEHMTITVHSRQAQLYCSLYIYYILFLYLCFTCCLSLNKWGHMTDDIGSCIGLISSARCQVPLLLVWHVIVTQ